MQKRLLTAIAFLITLSAAQAAPIPRTIALTAAALALAITQLKRWQTETVKTEKTMIATGSWMKMTLTVKKGNIWHL
jgi:hypothetical protein